MLELTASSSLSPSASATPLHLDNLRTPCLGNMAPTPIPNLSNARRQWLDLPITSCPVRVCVRETRKGEGDQRRTREDGIRIMITVIFFGLGPTYIFLDGPRTISMVGCSRKCKTTCYHLRHGLPAEVHNSKAILKGNWVQKATIQDTRGMKPAGMQGRDRESTRKIKRRNYRRQEAHSPATKTKRWTKSKTGKRSGNTPRVNE